MSTDTMKNWRGFLYIALGIAFGIYRGLKVEDWSAWDLLDQLLAVSMAGVGLYLILRK